MSEQERNSYIPLRIMGRRLGIPEERVRAVGRAGKLKLSEQGDCRIKYKDETITVIDPARALGRPNPDAAAGDHIAVLKTADGLFGILVEGHEPALAATLVPLPEPFAGWSGDVLTGLATADQELLPVLDCDRLPSFRAPQESHTKAAASDQPLEPIPSSGASAANSRVVLFPVGAENEAPHLGLSLIQIPEVRDDIAFAWMPGAPTWVWGISRWQNRAAIALDIGELCGLGRTTPERWVVVQGFSEKERFLVPVGRDVRILPAAGAREDSVLPEWAQSWMHGAYALQDTPFWLLDVDRVSGAWQGHHG